MAQVINNQSYMYIDVFYYGIICERKKTFSCRIHSELIFLSISFCLLTFMDLVTAFKISNEISYIDVVSEGKKMKKYFRFVTLIMTLALALGPVVGYPQGQSPSDPLDTSEVDEWDGALPFTKIILVQIP